jgi:competence/damage-inducible protein CinA-like protein
MPSAEIIVIGTELLLGETIDTNTQVIALALRQIGVDVFRTSTIGDNPGRIAQILLETIRRTDIVITTGGLGPTEDDPTRAAISNAFDLDLVFMPDLWEYIIKRFAKYDKEPTENNKQQAYLPEGAESIPNPRGTAAGIFLELPEGLLFSLPGVPHEMEGMLIEQVIPRIKSKFSLSGVILTRNIRVEGVGESKVDSEIRDLEQLHNPTVGLAAGKGYVLIRITAKEETEEAANDLLDEMEGEIKSRLSEWIPAE